MVANTTGSTNWGQRMDELHLHQLDQPAQVTSSLPPTEPEAKGF